MPIKATYRVSSVDPKAVNKNRAYDLKLIKGECPFTKALIANNAHGGEFDLQHPYGRLEDLVADAVDRAEEQGKVAHLTIEISESAPMWPEDAIYLISQRSIALECEVIDATKRSAKNPNPKRHTVIIANCK